MPAAQFAVFGHPISHSLSPQIHHAFGQQFGIELEYRAIDAAPEAFAEAVRRFFLDGGRGANVTLPHKAAAFALANERSASAIRVGSANVLTLQRDGTLAAHNTDGDGMVRDITERHGTDLRGHTALLLGAGGAARGVAWHLLDAGVATLTIVNRSPEAADALADAIGDPARAHTRYWHDLADIGSFDLIVNATSAGVRCVQLTADNRCAIFGQPDRPAVCTRLRAEPEMCGHDRRHALAWLRQLEAATAGP
jgi:shikimate dehydrogenase